MQPRINLITLGVDDWKKTLDFYEAGLGWKRSSASQDDIVFFQLNGVVLSLYPRNLLAEDATVSPGGNDFAGITFAYNTHSVQEVDDVLARVEALGATLVKPAQKAFWGGYSGYFKDPNGYLFEVAYNPFFELDEAGNIKLP